MAREAKVAEGGSEGQEDEEKPGKGKKGRLLGRNVEATRDLGITPNWRTSRRVSFCMAVDETPLSTKNGCVVCWKQAPHRQQALWTHVPPGQRRYSISIA